MLVTQVGQDLILFGAKTNRSKGLLICVLNYRGHDNTLVKDLNFRGNSKVNYLNLINIGSKILRRSVELL